MGQHAPTSTLLPTAPGTPEPGIPGLWWPPSELTFAERCYELSLRPGCRELAKTEPQAVAEALSTALDVCCEMMGVLPAYRPSPTVGRLMLEQYRKHYGHLTPEDLVQAFTQAATGAYGNQYRETYQSFDLPLLHGVMQAYVGERNALAREVHTRLNYLNVYLAEMARLSETALSTHRHIFWVIATAWAEMAEGVPSTLYTPMYESPVEYLIYVGAENGGMAAATEEQKKEYRVRAYQMEREARVAAAEAKRAKGAISEWRAMMNAGGLEPGEGASRATYYRIRLEEWLLSHILAGHDRRETLLPLWEGHYFVDTRAREALTQLPGYKLYLATLAEREVEHE